MTILAFEPNTRAEAVPQDDTEQAGAWQRKGRGRKGALFFGAEKSVGIVYGWAWGLRRVGQEDMHCTKYLRCKAKKGYPLDPLARFVPRK